jgi:hypothetical protein
MQPEGSLSSSQEPSNRLYPHPHKIQSTPSYPIYDPFNIMMCMVLHATKATGSSSDDCIY